MDKFKTAVILAGGKSSRMGFDKQFLQIQNESILNNTINKLREEFEEIIIVTNKPEFYSHSSCKIVSDEIKEKGPLGGLHIGLKESSSQYAYFIACDMPNINIHYIRYMKSKLENSKADACVTRGNNNIEPFNGFYSKGIIAQIEKQILENKRALFYLFDKINTYYINEEEAKKYSPNWDMFANINTKEELDAYTGTIKAVH